MNNDLISRSALKKEMNRPFWEKWEWEFICKSIDNAPTVVAFSATAKKGEWIEKRDNNGNVQIYCNICGKKAQIGYIEFCGCCGADMRGEKNDSK